MSKITFLLFSGFLFWQFKRLHCYEIKPPPIGDEDSDVIKEAAKRMNNLTTVEIKKLLEILLSTLKNHPHFPAIKFLILLIEKILEESIGKKEIREELMKATQDFQDIKRLLENVAKTPGQENSMKLSNAVRSFFSLTQIPKLSTAEIIWTTQQPTDDFETSIQTDANTPSNSVFMGTNEPTEENGQTVVFTETSSEESTAQSTDIQPFNLLSEYPNAQSVYVINQSEITKKDDTFQHFALVNYRRSGNGESKKLEVATPVYTADLSFLPINDNLIKKLKEFGLKYVRTYSEVIEPNEPCQKTENGKQKRSLDISKLGNAKK